MSKALDYLIEVRGEAILPYFKFLKEAGKNLDVKTRDLISVITKVDKQTEKGLKQYLNRALHDGCTANEIIDALLLAFPTLGLTKIIWAIEIILAMKIPDFNPEILGQKPQWNEICSTNEIKDGEVMYMTIGLRNLFIYRNKDSYKVFDSRCPHRSEDIKPEALEGLKLTCPRHKWEFNMSTGECTANNHGLRTFEIKIENNVLFGFW
ncbi:MAG: Rieske 2Fe-2S domain-containing protein [Spirochaetia bacterium]|nr:Rieske 2Fe-2S domain-containing protein [Spirochaetia bacterium]